MWPNEDIDNLVNNIISKLYNDQRLSDLTVRLKDGTTLHAHKLILAARSKIWHNQFLSPPNSPTQASNTNLAQVVDSNHLTSSPQLELDWTDYDTEAATGVLTWVYSGQFEYDALFPDEQFIFSVMKIAKKFRLTLLINLCEKCLLAMAPEVGLDKIARLLLEGQANMNTTNDEGYTLLHLAILNKDEKGAVYLLKNSADVNIKTPNNQTPLELAIRNKLAQVVRFICQKSDFDLKNSRCSNGDPPIWLALTNLDEYIASILVEYNCDINSWDEVDAKFTQNLLHRALDQNDESTACFLIRSGCDCNAPRRPLKDGQGDEEAFDNQTPLHIACGWNMLEVVQTLLEHHADINAQDAEGKTPLHVAISNQHDSITKILVDQQQLDLKLRDKYGNNAFAEAMSKKNNKAASIILEREPHAAERYDPKGRTFLHLAILKNDIESVLFLLSVHANIHSRVQDSSKFAPIHLAVQVGSEMILRNLLLAGANINDLTVQNQTALHISASLDHHLLCQILLENGVNFEMVDVDLNNALHLACQNGNFNSCRILLAESQIKADAINLRGQNPIHLLAHHGRENAAAILETFMQSMPEYPINTQDSEGNTALLLAYKNGNANLCRTLIRFGACLALTNKSGVNIFNAQVASKKLLFLLLDFITIDPPWADGDSCVECQLKFGITNRKHHCRHCGRLLCAKCSPREIVITKFKSTKPSRVCSICAEILEYGDTHTG